MIDIKKIEEIIRRYYPINVSPFSEEFDTSDESRLRAATMMRRRENRKNNWNELLKSLAENYDPDYIRDISNAMTMDPSMYVTFDEYQNYYLRVHVWISLLIQYHTIEIYWYSNENIKRLDLKSIERSLLDNTNKLIQKHFGTKNFPENLKNITISNVSVQGANNPERTTVKDLLFGPYIANF